MKNGQKISETWLMQKLRWASVSLLTTCVRAYQVVLSPHLGNCCRFEPSCSNYCILALHEHGFWKGMWLSLCRIVRCRPYGACGYDPVPSGNAKINVKSGRRDKNE